VNEEKIEEPNEKDFESTNTKNSVPLKSNDIVEPTHPKWLAKNVKEEDKEEKIELPEGMEKAPRKILSEIGKEVKPSTDSADKKQVNWLEGDVEKTSLEQDVLNETKTATTPKWITASKEAKERQKEEDLRTPKNLSTPVDRIFELLNSYKTSNVTELASYSGLTIESVELIARKFEEENIVEMKYYTTPGKRPSVILKEDIPSNIQEIPKGTILDKYEMIVDFVPVLITIVEVKGEPRPIYTLGTPSIGKYTRKFLDIVKDEVAETMPIELEEILDPKKSKKLKVRFFKELTKNLARYLPAVSTDLINPLSGLILHELYGLGDIELFMADDMLEEVAINSAKTPLTVYHRIYGWMKTNVFLDGEEKIVNYSSQIGRKVGREITVLKPILDAHLLSGDRVNATLFPVSSEGNTLTIRRFARKPWTIIDFIGKSHTMTSEMAAFLWIAMQYEMNVLVAGGTASGKTSALNTLLAMVPPYHRIISIEDVREIILPKYLMWNWVPLVTRSPNPEGIGEVTMLELMQSSLRMRPDRIIVGEIRRHKEAEVLMEAIETGHSIYSTMHANSAYQVLRRLVEPPMNIPPLQVELLDIIIVQYRDRKTNKRRTYEIAEIEQTSSGQGLQVNTIYKWSPRNDNWDKLSKPVKLLTLLNLHTGLTEEDIMLELKDRQMILEWMINNNITSLDDIGLVMKIFYSDADKVKKLARKNVSIDEFKTKI
jgi:flagellar protein FlaI